MLNLAAFADLSGNWMPGSAGVNNLQQKVLKIVGVCLHNPPNNLNRRVPPVVVVFIHCKNPTAISQARGVKIV
jgi:hypothetical protein